MKKRIAIEGANASGKTETIMNIARSLRLDGYGIVIWCGNVEDSIFKLMTAKMIDDSNSLFCIINDEASLNDITDAMERMRTHYSKDKLCLFIDDPSVSFHRITRDYTPIDVIESFVSRVWYTKNLKRENN